MDSVAGARRGDGEHRDVMALDLEIVHRPLRTIHVGPQLVVQRGSIKDLGDADELPRRDADHKIGFPTAVTARADRIAVGERDDGARRGEPISLGPEIQRALALQPMGFLASRVGAMNRLHQSGHALR